MLSQEVIVGAASAIGAAGVTAVVGAIIARRGQDKSAEARFQAQLIVRLDKLNARVDALEAQHDEDEAEMDDMHALIRCQREQIEALQHDLGTERDAHASSRHAMQKRVTLLERRIAELEAENLELRRMLKCEVDECPARAGLGAGGE